MAGSGKVCQELVLTPLGYRWYEGDLTDAPKCTRIPLAQLFIWSVYFCKLPEGYKYIKGAHCIWGSIITEGTLKLHFRKANFFTLDLRVDCDKESCTAGIFLSTTMTGITDGHPWIIVHFFLVGQLDFLSWPLGMTQSPFSTGLPSRFRTMTGEKLFLEPIQGGCTLHQELPPWRMKCAEWHRNWTTWPAIFREQDQLGASSLWKTWDWRRISRSTTPCSRMCLEIENSSWSLMCVNSDQRKSTSKPTEINSLFTASMRRRRTGNRLSGSTIDNSFYRKKWIQSI